MNLNESYDATKFNAMWNNNYIMFPTVRIVHFLESYALCAYVFSVSNHRPVSYLQTIFFCEDHIK